MNLLEEIKQKRKRLNPTETVITGTDGCTYKESAEMRTLGLTPQKIEQPKKYGFVVDLKPDNVPVEIIKSLFIGSQDCTDDFVLKSYNFTNILSIGIDTNSKLSKKFIPCLDLPETDIYPVVLEANSYINEVLKNNGILLVHCNAGVSRSATIIIGFLILEMKYPFYEAYNLLKTKRPSVQPNVGFVRQLKLLENVNEIK